MKSAITQPGMYAIYKPVGVSSYDCIRELKRAFRGEKIGHGGTLDPLAEGILVVAIGSAYTKQLQPILKGTTKVYEATIFLGATSATDDSEGPIASTPLSDDWKPPTQSQIKEILKDFTGIILQTPPIYAAVKVKGVSAYKRARKGESFTLEPKAIHIDQITLRRYDYPELVLEIECGSGTYIRALARDIGERLGCGAYLKALKRTRVGDFMMSHAYQLLSSKDEGDKL